ncbi:hypothetical protein CCACVL1_05916 [Corchorus capsularis]|uniref:Uncharacterized protein n=1 Tax=Corchorus capsularis TaxID=210143 RepID=A0A1R3JIA7_COCAP|nr:hypothetical protein CCACVL1_05916 [Corchorus capsularis]
MASKEITGFLEGETDGFNRT